MKRLEWLLSVDPTDEVEDLNERWADKSVGGPFAGRWLEPRQAVNDAAWPSAALSNRSRGGSIMVAEVAFEFLSVQAAQRYADKVANWLCTADLVHEETPVDSPPLAAGVHRAGDLIAWWQWFLTDIQVLRLAVREIKSCGHGVVVITNVFNRSGGLTLATDADFQWHGWEQARRPCPRNEPTMEEVLASVRRIIDEDSHLQAT